MKIPFKNIFVITFCVYSTLAHADAAGEKKKAQLALVKQIAVVPIFFSSSTLFKPEDSKAVRKPDSPEKKQDKVLENYRSQLRKLEEDARTILPQRTISRTPFTVLEIDKIDAALKELKLTPLMLFQNGGKMKGGKFPLPDTAAVQKLCAFLHLDAIIMGTMDEPRRTNGQYYFDPGGLNYDSAHVETKAGMFLMKSDGTEILHDYIETLHPVTKRSDKDFVMVDWKESTELMIEDFLDEVCRYAPAKR